MNLIYNYVSVWAPRTLVWVFNFYSALRYGSFSGKKRVYGSGCTFQHQFPIFNYFIEDILYRCSDIEMLVWWNGLGSELVWQSNSRYFYLHGTLLFSEQHFVVFPSLNSVFYVVLRLSSVVHTIVLPFLSLCVCESSYVFF